VHHISVSSIQHEEVELLSTEQVESFREQSKWNLWHHKYHDNAGQFGIHQVIVLKPLFIAAGVFKA